jgi:pyrroline-5-carboxylate reductase
MSDYELGIIGAGNMSEAILRGALSAGVLQPGQVIAADPDGSRREVFGELGVVVTDDNTAAAQADRLLLAVKPQVMPEVLSDLASAVAADAMVISIAAGVKCKTLDEALDGRGRIVRVMPNTPALVGEGASGVAAGPRGRTEDVDWVVNLLTSSGGLAVTVDEEQLDAVTAVSGSGPAYFFYLVEAMVAAGVAEGLDETTALQLASQTCLGAGKLLLDSRQSPGELRRRVTSKGGTTQRAIETLDGENVSDQLLRAVRAAAARSRELG